MQFVDNINPNPLASRNAADISLTGIDVSTVNITVKYLGTTVCTFVAEPHSNALTIRLPDILSSILRPYFQEPSGLLSTAELGAVSIEAYNRQATSPTPWSRMVFPAGYDSALHTALMNSYWWTWRPQRCRTFASGKEYIATILSSGTTPVYVEATFSDGTTDEEMLHNIGVGDGKKLFAVIDVSYSRIAALFPDKSIVSYKVRRSGSAYSQIYEVSHLRPRRVFVFRNSLGMFDTVYATGNISDGASRDIKTFIGADRAEGISSNDSREKIYVNSGHIDTSGERTLWNEMMLSEDVWEYVSGNFRKIIIDAFDMKLLEAASASMTFEYHYAKKPAGNGYTKSEI